MTYQILSRDDHFLYAGRPKRILALDGGGLRCILSLGILEKLRTCCENGMLAMRASVFTTTLT
jgi:hypothetical protein